MNKSFAYYFKMLFIGIVVVEVQRADSPVEQPGLGAGSSRAFRKTGGVLARRVLRGLY